jgi:hypothetical protein
LNDKLTKIKDLVIKSGKYSALYTSKFILGGLGYAVQMASNGILGLSIPDYKLPNLKFDSDKYDIGDRVVLTPSKFLLKDKGISIGQDYNSKHSIIYPIDHFDDLCKTFIYVGAPGCGKSTLAENNAIQIARINNLPNFNTAGFCAIDVADGMLIENILMSIPEDRLNDVILLDFSNKDFLPSINLLEFDEKVEKQFPHFIHAEIISFFKKRFGEQIGFASEDLLSNSLNAILKQTDYPKTLLGIIKMLTESEYREQILSSLRKNKKNASVVRYWDRFEAQSPSVKRDIVKPLLNKVGNLTNNDYLKSIICQNKSTVDFRKIMDEGKILLIKAPKVAVGKVNIEILIPLIISKFWIAALSRFDTTNTNLRRPFFAFLDEPQMYLSNEAGIEEMLTEMRKYRFGLHFFFQSPEQTQLQSVIKMMLEVHPQIVSFAIGRGGAMTLFKEFETGDEDKDISNRYTLLNLPKYHALCRFLYKSDKSVSLVKCSPPIKHLRKKIPDIVMQNSQKYLRSIDEIMEEILESDYTPEPDFSLEVNDYEQQRFNVEEVDFRNKVPRFNKPRFRDY